MKKFLKIFVIVILSLLLIIIAVPFIFKKQIEEKVKTEINNNVNAKVDFKSFKLSLIRSFPDFYMALEGLTVVGIDTFANDTLVSFEKFSTRLDLVSVIKMENIKVKAIILEKPVIHAIVLKNGKANWDIAKPSADTTEVVDTAKSEPTAFKISLKKFAIRNANITYDDQVGGMSASMKNFNFELAGDLSADFTSIKILSTTDAINFVMGGIPYLKNASNKIDITIDADLKNSVYTLKDNEFALNDIVLSWNGSVAMKDTNIITDMTFNTKRTDFKSLLSLVPGIYMQGFESVQTSGSLKLDGSIKGTYNAKTMPNAALNLFVDNASFKYPDLPKSVDNINIAVKVLWDGVQNDNSTVDIDKFHFEIAKNPVDITLNLKTPISDPAINCKVNCNLDIATLADVVPMDSTTLLGRIEAKIDMMGKMSMIEQEKYEEFKADGSIILTGFQYSSPDLKQGATIEKTILLFSPRFVELATFDAKVGNSDIHMKGKLTNFIAYALKGGVLEGNLDFSSNLLDLNEFMSGEPEQPVAEEPVDTTQMSTIEVPKNINFTLTTNIKKINYDKIAITNVGGNIKVADGKINMNNLNMNMLDGSMNMNGEYNTQDMSKPFADMKLDIKDFDIPSTFKAFNTVQKLAPIAQDATGKFSILIGFKTLLDAHMSPLLNTMNGEGKLSSKQVAISNSKTFGKIADALKNEKLRNISMTDINLSFTITEGRIFVKPFDTKIIGYKTNISGDQGIDQTMNYLMKMAIPRADFGSAANSALNSLTSAASAKGVAVKVGDMVNVGITVTGTVSDPKVGVKLGDPEGGSVKEQAKEQVKQVVEEKKAEVKEAVSKKADELLAKAQKEADAVKAAAKQAADAVRKESNANATKLVKEASNPLAKKAAEVTADKMRKEGEQKAKKIESEGNSKADAIMKKAQEEANKLK
jgi:hypothetical protein